jgi:enoyl-CoA hydratase
MTKAVRLEYDGPIAVITNDNVEKHNAFDDDMDQQLFTVLAELKERPDVRAVIWRGEGKSFSSGRDGASFQRALLCDIRVAAEGARFMLPEVTHGVIPDTGGVGRLYQICGHGVASDLVLTGRPMGVDEAYAHGIVSRVVAPEALDDTVREMAERIAAAPAVTVKMARRVLKHLAEPEVRSSMAEEMIAQTFIAKSDDLAEFRTARAEGRDPHFTGS